MPDYIYLIHPMRHEFFENPTAQEEEVMKEHFEYLRKATLDGVVLMAGPCLDETFGIVVFKADSEETARAFMLNDPSVENNVMMAELHPLQISLIQGADGSQPV